MGTMFSVWFVPKFYKQGQSSSGVRELSAVHSWLLCERAQLTELSVESQPVKRRQEVRVKWPPPGPS
jgi:hypothetical protein